MSFGVVFIVNFGLMLSLVSSLVGYARHMGRTEPTNWWVVFAISAALALVGTGIAQGLWSFASFILAGAF